jgi:hypothetical protein
MTETNKFEILETNNTEIIQEKIKKKTGPKGPHKIKRKPERWLDDGKYNKPLDPDYFKKYWKEHYQKPAECIICGKILLCCDKLKRHEKSKQCQKAKLLFEASTV